MQQPELCYIWLCISTLSECLLLLFEQRDFLHTVKHHIVCQGRGVLSTKFMFIGTAVVEIAGLYKHVPAVKNNTLANIVCCCFSYTFLGLWGNSTLSTYLPIPGLSVLCQELNKMKNLEIAHFNLTPFPAM